MARRNKGLVELLADSPWPAGLIVGATGFLVIRYGLGWSFSTFGGRFMTGVGTAFSDGALAPLAWLFLGMGALASLASLIRSRHRAATLDNNRTLQQIRDLSWIRFEQLVGEAFRRQGYAVEETGLGGADGGIDLRLRREGQLHLVQCKQWRRERVGVNVVREMFGLLVHHGAHRVKIVTIGDFTPDARAFARDKPVDCITGAQLLQLIDGLPLHATDSMPSTVNPARAADCPTCGSTMTTRTNRRSGERFLGCTRYPACRGTRKVDTNALA
ncbi:restriction endonuclease [Chiayiivirga flava]|uniref:Restriction system protein n=1 Tax=Chiayiivirga flava TaxID=659595 RepID=A0A7W8FY87_9GAMM|nr:restriction endonuclease [Chiayiivirga flava]MBB5206856.1 restriction system protein [Chiayiivirga flava]